MTSIIMVHAGWFMYANVISSGIFITMDLDQSPIQSGLFWKHMANWQLHRCHFCRNMFGHRVHVTRKSLKKIYDEVTEDIFDMSNVNIFK